MGIPFLACMAAAAAFYHLPPRVLPSIQAVEGGRPGLAHVNADGSEDLGVMQVNTRWIGPLARAAGLPPDAVRARLRGDGCFNVAAAGAIMRTYLNEAGQDLVLAVGYYHSHRAAPLRDYQLRVLRSARLLFAPAAPTRTHVLARTPETPGIAIPQPR